MKQITESCLRGADHERFAEAMLLCQHAGAFCAQDGFCHYDGECFDSVADKLEKHARRLWRLHSAIERFQEAIDKHPILKHLRVIFDELDETKRQKTMDFEKLNGLTIQEAFELFDQDNPTIYQAIKDQAMKAINLGRKRVSIKAIVNWLRWNWFVDTTDQSSTYKINDAYISHYARKFVKEHPEHEDKIELRRLRSSKPTKSQKGLFSNGIS